MAAPAPSVLLHEAEQKVRVTSAAMPGRRLQRKNSFESISDMALNNSLDSVGSHSDDYEEEGEAAGFDDIAMAQEKEKEIAYEK